MTKRPKKSICANLFVISRSCNGIRPKLDVPRITFLTKLDILLLDKINGHKVRTVHRLFINSIQPIQIFAI